MLKFYDKIVYSTKIMTKDYINKLIINGINEILKRFSYNHNLDCYEINIKNNISYEFNEFNELICNIIIYVDFNQIKLESQKEEKEC